MAEALKEYINALIENGRYTFTHQDILKTKKFSSLNLGKLLWSARKRKLLISPVSGFHVVVLPQYKTNLSVPIESYIHALMNYLKQPYYVGLLSAAKFYGGTHHAVQSFQVITTKARRAINVSLGSKINFHGSKFCTQFPKRQKNTQTSTFLVSTPEATVFDLVINASACGGLDFVATVIKDISSELDPKELIKIAKIIKENAVIKRLGFILEKYSQRKDCVEALARTIKNIKNDSPTPLIYGKSVKGCPINKKWNLYINEKLEVEA